MHNSMEEYIHNLFGNYLESQMSLADYLPENIAQAAQKIVDCLLQDGKIFICGSGASAANALHFSIGLMHQYHVERPALPAIVLAQDFVSTSAHSGDFTQVFSRQIQALGSDKDLLLILTTSGDSSSLIQAVDAAKERGMDILTLSGKNGGMLSNHLGPDDLEIKVKLDHPARIRETHLFILHCLCDLIDQSLFGALR
jgi:D-sedoheptulose 7-phosphate isomerase